jgi:hypothetical protein
LETTRITGIMLSVSAASVGLVHTVRAPPVVMTAPATGTAVKSWYDSGIRLTRVSDVVVPPSPAVAELPKPSASGNTAPTGVVGTRPAYVWNPKGLTVDGLPEELQPFKDQFVPEFVTGVPSYLDGKTYQGDVGFDPWALVALADRKPDELQGLLWAKDRKARLEAMTPDQQAASVAWMREAELKHARLAMLAAAGWPLAELINPLRATGGRAPSLFNGQLVENLLPVAILFGALALVEIQTKGTSSSVSEKVVGYGEPQVGDYGFDPLKQYTKYLPTKEMQLAEVKHGRAASARCQTQTRTPLVRPSLALNAMPASRFEQ